MEAVGNTDEGDGASAEFGVGNAELKCITHRNRFEISYPFHPFICVHRVLYALTSQLSASSANCPNSGCSAVR